ncbi:hypothetical protein CEXT_258561 [Caerostris extrusa]|uniref:Uncharacterized protein n=1 Tax=Caerostris extrusa TaxID=172846 RepID=A0AAV4WGM5_CAEEX|nr:hypothetical protein CEXT_258561 [Caerostris extrusa]
MGKQGLYGLYDHTELIAGGIMHFQGKMICFNEHEKVLMFCWDKNGNSRKYDGKRGPIHFELQKGQQQKERCTKSVGQALLILFFLLKGKLIYDTKWVTALTIYYKGMTNVR